MGGAQNWGIRMMHEDADDKKLEAYFQAERGASVAPSDDLMARILADATAQQVPVVGPVLVSNSNPWPAFWAAIGGWPTVTGMTTAGLVGVWVGFSQPIGLDELANNYLGLGADSYLVDLLPAFGDEFEKG